MPTGSDSAGFRAHFLEPSPYLSRIPLPAFTSWEGPGQVVFLCFTYQEASE